jgi:hypothetical protein
VNWLRLLIALISTATAANAQISLPLQGYFRPGKFMPVRVDGPCEIKIDGGANLRSQRAGIAPVLMYDADAQIEGTTIPLHPIGDDERLVGGEADADIFPGNKTVRIPLEAADLLASPAGAWEALDAIVLDSAEIAKIDDRRRSALLASGVLLGTHGTGPPDNRWPWIAQGSLWVLRCSPLGPKNRVVDESVYAPTFAWTAALPAQLRRWILSAGALLAIAAIGLSFWNSRWAVVAIVLLAAATTAAVAMGQRSIGAAVQSGGDIVIEQNNLVQRDIWLFQRARQSGRFAVTWEGSTHPIAASLEQLRQATLEVVLNTQGSLRFSWHSDRGDTMAFLRREITPGNIGPASSEFTSPMEELARTDYLSPQTGIRGQQPAEPGRWASVVIGPR